MTVDEQLAQVAIALCDSVGTTVSEAVKRLILSDDIEGLASMTLDPTSYSDPISFLRDTSCVDLLRKVAFPGNSQKRRQAAIDNFWNGERSCCQTNAYFSNIRQNGNLAVRDLRLIQILDRAKDWIRNVLGPLPSSLVPKFGPGSTFSDRGRLTTVPDKISHQPCSTRGCSDLWPFVYRTAWGRALLSDPLGSSPVIVRGNRFTTVPKDSQKDRGICIEPSINVALQLSVGSFISQRLSRNNLDIQTGQGRHRDWAAWASFTGNYATLDLSNASDTISYELVRYLLPNEWFSLLDTLRSPSTLLDGRWVHLEKFSSMGNGFTFELETLIFAAICFSAGCSDNDFSVYGDDMIVPTTHADSVQALLSCCGFSVNSRKTFTEGPFRESCGGDFFNGVSVRAHFLKEIPHEPQDWIRLANGLKRAGSQDHTSPFAHSFVFTAWLQCLRNLPSNIRRLRGPIELGDLVIHDDKFSRRFRSGRGYVRVYRPVHRRLSLEHWKPEVIYASLLYGGIQSTGVLPRESVYGYKIGWVAFS